jgi:hypothetical protein
LKNYIRVLQEARGDGRRGGGLDEEVRERRHAAARAQADQSRTRRAGAQRRERRRRSHQGREEGDGHGEIDEEATTCIDLEDEDVGVLLGIFNVTNKSASAQNTIIAFTREYSRVSYPLRNVYRLS